MVATWIFILGQVLIGFAFLIWILPKFFATLCAIVFCIAGVGCIVTAIKIFLAARKADKVGFGESHDYRENVQVHVKENHLD